MDRSNHEEPSATSKEPGDNAEPGVRPNRSEGLVPEQVDDEWNESDHFGKDVS